MHCNTATFTSVDGKQMAFPLGYLIERGALVASQVNGEDIADVMGAVNQLWIPGLPANFFLRDIVRIDFTEEAVIPPAPQVECSDDINRPNIAAAGPFRVVAGEPIPFKGWASDYDRVIEAVELSLDGGESWMECPCPGATRDRLLYWTFTCEGLPAGSYQLQARARSMGGAVSPIAAIHRFEVMPAE